MIKRLVSFRRVQEWRTESSHVKDNVPEEMEFWLRYHDTRAADSNNIKEVIDGKLKLILHKD